MFLPHSQCRSITYLLRRKRNRPTKKEILEEQVRGELGEGEVSPVTGKLMNALAKLELIPLESFQVSEIR